MTSEQSGWDVPVGYANEILLDREIIDPDDVPVGKVDDLLFDVPDDGRPPVLTAILCGPTALGPRVGGRIGTWWVAIARRLRPYDDAAPIEVDIGDVDRITSEALQLRIRAANVGTWRLQRWVDSKIIQRIPGGT